MRRKRHAGDMTMFGHGHHYAWEKVRRAIMRRDVWRCQACAGRAEVVDHIRPRWADGRDSWDNLQALRGSCHRIKTLTEFPSAVAGQQRLIHGPSSTPSSSLSKAVPTVTEDGTSVSLPFSRSAAI